jgi:hypothetical protein
MLVEYFDVVIPVYVSLMVILVCISGGIAYSMWVTRGSAGNAAGPKEKGGANVL